MLDKEREELCRADCTGAAIATGPRGTVEIAWGQEAASTEASLVHICLPVHLFSGQF